MDNLIDFHYHGKPGALNRGLKVKTNSMSTSYQIESHPRKCLMGDAEILGLELR